jgi:hypothetical protein
MIRVMAEGYLPRITADYGSPASEVRRSLYIGDVLYTISSKQIMANSLGDINTTIATIPLPPASDIYYPVVKG